MKTKTRHESVVRLRRFRDISRAVAAGGSQGNVTVSNIADVIAQLYYGQLHLLLSSSM